MVSSDTPCALGHASAWRGVTVLVRAQCMSLKHLLPTAALHEGANCRHTGGEHILRTMDLTHSWLCMTAGARRGFCGLANSTR